MKDSTFFLIKPDAVDRNLTGVILAAIENEYFYLTNLRMIRTNQTLIESHYQEHRNTKYFHDICETLVGDVIAGTLFYAKDPRTTVEAFRRFVGPYNNPSPDTLRGRFAIDFRRNSVHSSATQFEAERERNLWLLAK